MPYENIPGVKATYLDGAFKIPSASSQPKILVVGPASSGLTNEIYNVSNIAVAEKEFGSGTEVLRAVHECVAQGADNLAIIRSGGQEGNWVFTDSDSNTLTVTPSYRDDDILGRYALFIENDGSSNRYMVYDLTDEEWVYDSDETLILDEGIVTVEDSGIDLFSLFDKDDIPSADALDTVGTSDFTADGTATALSVVDTEGTDGITVSRAERYAALNATYHLLDYRDADMVVPTDVYVDDANVTDDTNFDAAGTGSTDAEQYGYYWKGVPEAASAEDALGFSWEYRYKGRVFNYMTDVEDYFDGTDTAASLAIQTDLVITASKVGKGGNGVTVEIVTTGSGGVDVEITETDHGIDIWIEVDGTADTLGDIETQLAIDFAAKTLRSGVLVSALLGESSSASATVATALAKTNLAGGGGGAVLTHQDLTGETIPTAVSTLWTAGADVELREVNFAHQLATFCYVASTNWSTMVGSLSFKAPTEGYSRSKIADWIGVAPTLTDDGTDVYIDSPSDNGSGVLGHKLIAGFSKTSDGYRSAEVDGGNSTDGYAYGGLILTNGASLPNGTDWPYGISDADEATDAGGKAVDIGKHVFVSYDWPILKNAYDGGSSYRGAIPGTYFGKVATMPENEEPIGINGILKKTQSPTRVHSTQINDLAGQRIIGIRRDDTSGTLILTTAKTAAHPDSDYTRLSTIRCVNRMLAGIRNLARPYIGKDFSAQRLASLQSAIDAFIVSEQGSGMHQGAKARIEYSREDKIMGRLKIKLRMIPPFSIESITVETSLAADESEL
jgi:hypothetical protein